MYMHQYKDSRNTLKREKKELLQLPIVALATYEQKENQQKQENGNRKKKKTTI